MKELKCLCGEQQDVVTVYEQNFPEDILTPENFSARGKHDFGKDHLHYRIVRCRKCSQLFSTPVLEQEKIEQFYRNSRQDYTGETRNIVKAYLKPLLKREHLLNGKDSVLEIACGSGFCLEALKDCGFRRVTGVEPSIHAVKQAGEDIRPHILNCLFEEAEFSDNSADLICAFQVLDHFVNPAEVMKRLRAILKPNGLCYAVVHNEKAIQVKLFRDKSPIIDVSHIYYFNKKTLLRLFEREGFEIVALFDIWNTYTLATWFRMLPVPFKDGIMRGLRMVGADAVPLSIPAGNIGIIGRKGG